MITKPCDEIVILVKCDKVPAHIWVWEENVCETRRAIFIGRLTVKDQCQFTFKPHCDNLRVGVFSEDQILLKTNNELPAKITMLGYIYKQMERIQVWQYGT